MSISLILGRQGSGKTLYLVKEAYRYYLQGKTIYSNIAFKFPYKQLDYKDIIECKLENAVIFLDEIHLLLPARRSMRRINKEIVDGFLSMVRKKGLIIMGTTQTMRKVDIRFREECDFLYDCSKFAYINGKIKEVIHNENLSRKIPIIIKLNVQELYSGNMIEISFIGNEYFNKYDTRQIIKIKGLKKYE